MDFLRYTLLTLCLIFLSAVAAGAQTISVNGETPPNVVTVGAATGVAIAVADGPGNTTDWIALYPVGAANSGYVSWSYLSGTGPPPASGLMSTTFNTYAPLTPGDYEWRLFANNGWSRIATSGVVTVTASTVAQTVNGVTPPGEASVGAGGSITVSLVNGPGNSTDWIGLAPAGSANNALVDWRYLSGTTVAPATGQTNGTVQFLAPATPGSYEIRLFAHGTFGRVATSAITVSASTAALTVNDTTPPTPVSVNAGTYVSVGVAGGPAQPGDWVGLYAASATDSAILAWKYLNGSTTISGSGQSDATLTFAVPVAAGSYEFRFFNANTFTRLATSTTMAVSASAAALSVNGVTAPGSVTAAAGSQAVVSVADGPANVGDWVGLYLISASDSAVLDWRYLNDTAQIPVSGVSTSTLHFSAPTTPGTYEFRFFADGGYSRLATSGAVVVPQTPAQIAVNGVIPPTSVTVSPASTLTVDITGGPANPTDWAALAAQGAADSTFIAWQYLNGSSVPPSTGLSGATLSFVLPSAAGNYEVRLFAHNGYERITTSAPITASTGPPQVTVSMTSPFPGTKFNAPSSVLLSASASITGGTISRVDFYTGSTLIGSASAPPYAASWVSPSQAVHVLTAAVVDSTNAVTTSAPIAITIAPSGAGTGTLGAPIANPPGGTYGPGQTVTLTASPGAAIRYTIDGSDPAETSAIYNEALGATHLMTLRARAYQSGWGGSATTTEVYAIDSAPPTIIPTLNPPANANGWHRDEVTISFTCQDASVLASCPSPVIVTDEGEGQVVTVAAADVHGNMASTSITMNIDRTPPIVSISTPSNNLVTAASVVAVTGAVSDALAGVEMVKCNGDTATLDAESVGCSVALRPGLNGVVISVMDLAGNSASAGVRVRQVGLGQRLSIAPGEPTMRVGQTLVLQAVTEFGPVTAGLSWSVSAPGIVSLSTDAETSVLGDAPGVVTVTAELGNLVAETEITVVAGSLAFGTTLWKDISGTAGGTRVLYPPSGISGGADLFAVSSNPSGIGAEIRALDITGRVLWTESTSGEPLFGDIYGGLIALTSRDQDPGLHVGITRLAGAEGSPWTYEAIGEIVSRPVQTAEGLIVFAEQPESLGNGPLYLVGIEGQSGAMRFRRRAPYGGSFSLAYTGNCIGQGEPYAFETQLTLGAMAVGEDGAVYFQVLTGEGDYTLTDCSSIDAVATYNQSQELSVARLSPGGRLTMDSIWHDQHNSTTQQEAMLNQMLPGSVAPNGLGSVVASYEVHATRIHVAQGVQFEGVSAFLWSGGITRPVAPRHAFSNPPVDMQASPLEFVGDDGTIYLRNEAGVTAMDGASGTIKWTTPYTNLLVPQLNGGAAFQTPDGEIASIDGTGVSTIVGNLSIERPVQLRFGNWTGTSNGVVVAELGTPINESSFSFGAPESFFNLDQGVGGRERAGRANDGRFDSVDEAGRRGTEFLFDLASSSGWEWGGLICRQGQKFTWSRMVTDRNAGAVTLLDRPGLTQAQQDALPRCAPYGSNVPIGDFHAHLPEGQKYPSGFDPGTTVPNDLTTAALNPEMVFYLGTAQNNGKGRQQFKYQAVPVRDEDGQIVITAVYNTFKWIGSGWVRFTDFDRPQ